MRIDLPAARRRAVLAPGRPCVFRIIGSRCPRLVTFICLIVVTSAGLMAGPRPSLAQGFFESLFGIAKPKPGSKAARSRPRALRNGVFARIDRRPGKLLRYRIDKFAISRARARARRRYADGDNKSRRQRSRVKYHTYCVRRCDGYFFPVSHGVARGRFYRDANTCRSKCGDEARLYYRAGDAAAQTMVSVRGLAYSELKTAFLYRKKLVPGCRCKPQPWAQSERDRHRMYELNETAEQREARLAGDLKFLAGLAGRTKKTGKAGRPVASASAGRFAAVPARALGSLLPDAGGGPGAHGPAIAQTGREPAKPMSGTSKIAGITARRLRGRGRTGRIRRLAGRRRPRATAKMYGSAPWGLGSKPKYRWPGD